MVWPVADIVIVAAPRHAPGPGPVAGRFVARPDSETRKRREYQWGWCIASMHFIAGSLLLRPNGEAEPPARASEFGVTY